MRTEAADRMEFVPRKSKSALAEALFSLSQAQRRLAHRYKREALIAEAKNDYRDYAHCRLESNKLWRAALWHFEWCRREFVAEIKEIDNAA